jgi:hypothetical protein
LTNDLQVSSTSYPSLSAEDNSLVLEAELAVTRAKHDTRKEKARADSLEAELATVKAELAALKERLATLTRRRNWWDYYIRLLFMIDSCNTEAGAGKYAWMYSLGLTVDSGD